MKTWLGMDMGVAEVGLNIGIDGVLAGVGRGDDACGVGYATVEVDCWR